MLTLNEQVIKKGYCIGCGACSVFTDSPYTIKLNGNGCYQACIKSGHIKNDENESEICPFNNSAWNEHTLASKLFSNCNKYDNQIGYYQDIYTGKVEDQKIYNNGSSGGIAKWLLAKLLEEKLVDYIVQVYNNYDNPDKLFEYKITSSVEEVFEGSKSVYYPIEMSQVLIFIKNNPGSYAITGVPCFIKCIRLLQIKNPVYKKRIKYCIGIFCGHLKSIFYAEMIGWQLGVKPAELSYIDFRVKIKEKKANEKGVVVKSKNGLSSKPEIVQNIFGTNYGLGFFKYPACDFCDDVIAETADVSFGDAWLPQFLEEGTSMIISRNLEISKIFRNGIKEKDLKLNYGSAEQVYKSQEAGFRHKRDGLTVRLKDKQLNGISTPAKRIHKPVIDKRLMRIFRQRVKLTDLSFSTFKKAKYKNDFSIFKLKMENEVSDYFSLYKDNSLKTKLSGILIKIGLLHVALKLKKFFQRLLLEKLIK